MKEDRIERTFHPNGKIRSEIPYIGHKVNGMSRRWYENGVLASEYAKKNGLIDGVCRFWNEKGDLLGSYEMHEGTGTVKRWYSNGKLQQETNMIRGMTTGRTRNWSENGELINEDYRLEGRPVSKKKYMEACAKDLTLPRYEDDGKKPITIKESNIQDGIEKLLYPNGKIRSEIPYAQGKINGVCRFWNEKGALLGIYELKMGTGLAKLWHPNGTIECETTMVDGTPTGRMRCYDEGGNLLIEAYWLGGRQISKKKYLEACAKDPTLPRYEEDGKKPGISEDDLPSTKYRKRKSPVLEKERRQHEEIIVKFRAKPNQAEAGKWLADSETRNLGEMTPDTSREVVEEGYKAGAIKIIAADIQDETTDYLFVELPSKDAKRKPVFEWSNELAQQSGFDPEEDWGQSELFIFFD